MSYALEPSNAPTTDEAGVTSPVIKAYSLMLASRRDSFEGYRQEAASDLFQITPEQYVADRSAKTHGTANPSVMNKPFWKFQIGPKGSSAWNARTTFEKEDAPMSWDDPIWCFNRFGATRTKLPDGRIVCIGGEHEDGYDPDFCIYNGRSYLHPNQHGFEATRFSIPFADPTTASLGGCIH